jgi:hypothetical protein
MKQKALFPFGALVATLGMELSYLYLGLELVRKGLGLSHLAISLIMGLYLLSPVLKKLGADVAAIRRRSSWVSAILAMTMAFVVTLKAAGQVLRVGYPIFGLFLQIGFLGLAWWLGNSLASDELGYPHISLRFQVGIVALGVLAGASQFIPIIVFFVMALFALALSRWESSVAYSRGVLRPVSFLHLMAGMIAILLPVSLIFLALSPEVARAVIGWLLRVARKVGEFFQWQIAPPGGPPRSFNLFAGCRPAAEKGPLPQPQPLPSVGSSEINPILIWLFAFALFLALLTAIFLTVRKFRARDRTRYVPLNAIEVRNRWENIFRKLIGFFGWMGTRVMDFLRSLLRRRRRQGISVAQESPLSARTLYRLLLRWAAGQGLPRLPSQTAGEFLNRLSQKFPRVIKELQLITDVYVQARYSPRGATREDFEAAFRAWQRVIGSQHRS